MLLQSRSPSSVVTERPSLSNAGVGECRLPLACAPSWRHASGHVPLTSVSDMPRQPRSSRLRRGSDRVDHTSSHRRPCANGHRFSMAMPQAVPSTHAGFHTFPPWVGVSPPHCSQEIHHDQFHRKVLLRSAHHRTRVSQSHSRSEAQKGDAFLACDIAALNGPSDDVSYVRFDTRVSGSEAQHLVRRCIDAVEARRK